MKGLEHMLHTVSMINHSRRSSLPYFIVPTMHDSRSKTATDILQQLHEQYPGQVWDDVVPVDPAFREASKLGLPLPEMNPQAEGSLAYQRLLDQLIQTEAQRSHG
jgi:chromosome partitioning protein